MTQAYLEHANVSVRNPERASALLQHLFGWKERWRGPALAGGFTIHVGSDTHYVAYYTSPEDRDADAHFAKGAPLNHLAFVVDDLDEIERRVVEFGYEPFNHADYEPGGRFYFFDESGIEYEIVSYA